jgi:serine-type D-Ala-D-Ala carboxypeptidase (penicillin-binding protein 5/6)
VRSLLRAQGRAAPRAGVRGRGGSASLRGRALLVALVLALTMPAAALAVPAPQLGVTAADLIVEGSGQQLYGVNADAELPIASTTKIMTALVTLQHVQNLGTVFTQNDWYPASEDSQIGLDPGDRMTVHDLLEAMLLPSADDAAEDLAYNVGGGSVARFVSMMNADAQDLGLSHTHYSTPIGLDTPGNYSSASDLVRLSAYELMHEPFFRRVVDLPSATLATGPVRYVVNRNDLVARVPWIDGVKTGHTSGAGYVLVLSGRQDGMSLVGAVLGTTSEAARDENALALLDYGFAEYHQVRLMHTGQVMARPSVQDNPGAHAVVVSSAGFARIVERSARLAMRIDVPRQLAGPLPRHAVVGQVTAMLDGRAVARIPLLLARALPAISPLTLAGRFLTKGPTLVLLILLVGTALTVTARRRGRVRMAARNRAEAR